MCLPPVAESVKKGIEAAGGSATILQVPETLPQEVLQKMHAPPKPDYPIATPADLPQYDGFLFGVSTRYGGWSAQFKSFWDSTGQIWATGGLTGKFVFCFEHLGSPRVGVCAFGIQAHQRALEQAFRGSPRWLSLWCWYLCCKFL